ncbi:MAG: FAD-binding protein, partial [Myxococcota bacterium]
MESRSIFLERAAERLGEAWSLDEAARDAVAGDWSGLEPERPLAVVRPRSRDDVMAIAELAEEYRVGLVPRGAGTGKVGGAIPRADHVVIDLGGMNRIVALEPHDQYATVQPGVLTADLDRAAAEHGLMFPPDPASWETSTIGGNIATNAGGPRALKYGVTGAYVWGVELVLAGGDVLQTGRRSLKGVTGLDITSLVVGSEGTLGVVTEATVRLVPAPPVVEGAWLSVDTGLQAEAVAARIFSAGFTPRALELLDEEALAAVSAGHETPGDGAVAVHVELDGGSALVRDELERLCALAKPKSFVIAGDDEEREHFRALRRAASSALKERYPYKLSDDIAVPRS